MRIKTLDIIGEKQQAPTTAAAPGNLEPFESYTIKGASRDNQKTHHIDIQNNDKVLEFVFDDETTWICDASTLHELFPEVDQLSRSEESSFKIPVAIKGPEVERGLFSDVAVKVLNVFLKKPTQAGVVKVAKRLEDKLMEEGEGLFYLGKDLQFTPFDGKESDKPFLLFIHGTNSNTQGAFSKLAPSDTWNYIHTTYGQNVLSFQHRTLTKSPLQNVLELVGQLPKKADLHIISHSRGGLVGDILCRYADGIENGRRGFTETNIDVLRKEGREEDIKNINLLNKVFLEKEIEVSKFIRVACPAAGTKLASRRLDLVLNVFCNLLAFSLGPAATVVKLIKELIGETLKTKEDVNVLPGLEAQSPGSPFIKILNDRAPEAAINGSSLAIISGNGKFSASMSGLKVILGKLFYWQRNDLVVNTDSMYLGAYRKGDIQYFFDQGADVDHVKYFSNHKTREALLLALKTKAGELIPGFTCVEQHEVPSSDRELRGIEGGELYPYPDVPTGKKPIVVLLPGIMGSNLSRNGDKLWLAYLRTVFGGLKDLQYLDDKNIKAASLIKTSYKQLAERLSRDYDVVIYPYDWRRQLKECAKEFNDKIIELLKHEKPIKIIGHSMGGVLVRDFIINHADTWERLNQSKGFRLLFLGSPLGGSFRIATVLFGNDAIINSLNMLDRKHTKKELLTMFSSFPGILSLLPLTKGEDKDFASIDTWKKMAEAYGDNGWPLPNETDLEIFKKYRDDILAKQDKIDYSNMVYIAGKDRYTPCDYFNDDIPPRKELVFLYTGEGDQSVTWESGIPKQLVDSGAVYYVDVTHGALANEPVLFDGIEQILDKGFTSLLSKTKPMVRGEERLFRMTEVYNFDLSERGIENAVFGITEKEEPPVNQVPISISVSNGDLAYASFPVLAGHFLNDGILYAEKSIDLNMNESLTARHRLGIYPGEIGTSTVVAVETGNDGFPGAIIVGLGEPGNLTSHLLTKTVEQGVAKYLLDMNGKPGVKKEMGISSLIIGCGYGGLSVESSIKAIIEGVNNANDKVIAVHNNETRTIQFIEFIELYEDKALNCFYSLKKIESRENRIYNIRIGHSKIKELFGLKQRLPIDRSDEWWNRFTVKCRKDQKNGTEEMSLVFNASTGDAREEENELFSSTPLINQFIEQASTQNNWSASAAKTLFDLMIPNAFKDRLKRKGNINWVLDTDTAAYPWELLQENISNAKPLCINAGMIRQLSTPNYRLNIKRVATDMALVVADPQLNGFVRQLQGAEREGTIVKDLLTTYGYPNIPLISKTASEIVLNLFSNDYKIIHLAGHGIFNPDSPRKSGMVIGDNVFLTTSDIEQMSTVPELVFVNCCHLGKNDGEHEQYYQDRYKLAANIGTQLIRIGVKAVIAAGWAVNDLAAEVFARVFYSKMLEGYNFGEAVREARSAVYEEYRFSNNTWGAYQCYGDPFYRLVNRSAAIKEYAPEYVIEDEAVIDLTNLKNDLDTRNIKPDLAINRLRQISEACAKAEIRSGRITELEALIYFELAEYESAIGRFDALRKEENANFSVAALEKFCNTRGKKCVMDFKSGNSKGLSTSMNTIIAELNDLLKINRTSERLCLLGSAYKRKGIITSRANEKLSAYKKAAAYYAEAYELNGDAYPLNNWLVLQSALYYVQATPAAQVLFGQKKKDEMIEELTNRKARLTSSYTNMDYWGQVTDISYDLSLLMLDEQRAKEEANWAAIEKRFRQTWKRSGSKEKIVAEIENFEILSDVLSLSKSKHVQMLKDKVEQVKGRLGEIV